MLMDDFYKWALAAFLGVVAGVWLLGVWEGRLRRRAPGKASLLVLVLVLAPLLLLGFAETRMLLWDAGKLLRGEAEDTFALLRAVLASALFLVLLVVAAASYFGKRHPRPYAPSQFSPGPRLLWAFLYFFFGAIMLQGVVEHRPWRSVPAIEEAVFIGQMEVPGNVFYYAIAAVGGALVLLVCLAVLVPLHRGLKAGKPYQSPLAVLFLGTMVASYLVSFCAFVVTPYTILRYGYAETIFASACVVHGLLLLRRVDWSAPWEKDGGSTAGEPQDEPGKALASS